MLSNFKYSLVIKAVAVLAILCIFLPFVTARCDSTVIGISNNVEKTQNTEVTLRSEQVMEALSNICLIKTMHKDGETNTDICEEANIELLMQIVLSSGSTTEEYTEDTIVRKLITAIGKIEAKGVVVNEENVLYAQYVLAPVSEEVEEPAEPAEGEEGEEGEEVEVNPWEKLELNEEQIAEAQRIAQVFYDVFLEEKLITEETVVRFMSFPVTYSGFELLQGVDYRNVMNSYNITSLKDFQKQMPSVSLIGLAIAMALVAFVASFFKNRISYLVMAISSSIGFLGSILAIVAISNGFILTANLMIGKDNITGLQDLPVIQYQFGFFILIGLMAILAALSIMQCIFRPEFKEKISLVNKRAIAGYAFITPFIIGFLAFFLKPIIQSITFSFNAVTPAAGGYTTDFRGLYYYSYYLLSDEEFLPTLIDTLGGLLLDLPLIVIFSFFAATLLNKSFKGRGIARSIFFLPVILTSGVIIGIEASDVLMQEIGSSLDGELKENPTSIMSAFELEALLTSINLPVTFIGYITGAVNRMYSIISASGVQILVFLAALQSIPRSLYEASSVEGATGWEDFWKITLPMVSPFILVNIVYTIVDSFTKTTNEVIKIISSQLGSLRYSFASAAAWIYFLCILVILGVVVGVVSRFVFYYDER